MQPNKHDWNILTLKCTHSGAQSFRCCTHVHMRTLTEPKITVCNCFHDIGEIEWRFLSVTNEICSNKLVHGEEAGCTSARNARVTARNKRFVSSLVVGGIRKRTLQDSGCGADNYECVSNDLAVKTKSELKWCCSSSSGSHMCLHYTNKCNNK